MFRGSYQIARIMGILISIVLHELGHSAVAIRKGCRVREITLLFMGGAAVMERIPSKPLDEFLMAIAGPLVSLALGILGITAGLMLPKTTSGFSSRDLLLYLGQLNISLLLFNLLPAFPLDGGRVFRAVLTPKFGRLRATRVAARLGQFMAVLFGILGFVVLQFLHEPTGLITVVIAFFIFTAAGNEYRMVKMQEEAKQRGGFNLWPPIYDEPPPLPDDDTGRNQVIISPPPYEKGPTRKTDIHSTDEDDPFRDMFGHS